MRNIIKNKRISIKFQIAATFLGLLVLVIAVCIIMNTCFLENYYIKQKKLALKSAYSMLNDAFAAGNSYSDDIQSEIQRTCETYNISILILDEATETVYASASNSDMLSKQLLNNIFGIDRNMADSSSKRNNLFSGEKSNGYGVLEANDVFTIKIQTDFVSNEPYLEMWGVLDNGDIFLMRSAIDSITDSVDISNRFLVYIGCIIAVISVFLAMWASRKISDPLLELAEISQKMRELDFDAKYTGSATNEIGILGDNINELSETLEHTISELKSANNELEKDLAHKTEIDEVRKEFLSNVSHELKTPLALIQGYAEGLKDCVNEDDESRDYYCDVIMDEAEKMNSMVRKLLTLNQLEFGADTVNIERFDIVTLIKNYLQTIDILIKQNDATVVMEETEKIEVWADEFKVWEVLSNYLSNALNHLEGERRIDIVLKRINEDCVRVSVINTGNPIPEDCIDNIWEKFYKVDKARTREYGGSGVGLSIVKAIQEKMNQGYGVINHEGAVEFFFELDTRKRFT